MHVREEDRARAEVIAADLRRRERLGLLHVGVADDRQIVAEPLERRKAARRQIESGSGRRGRPEILRQPDLRAAGGAVHHFDRREPCPAGRRRFRKRRTGRNHRFEERQRHRGADTLQHRAA
jgi:hypothetical protein